MQIQSLTLNPPSSHSYLLLTLTTCNSRPFCSYLLLTAADFTKNKYHPIHLHNYCYSPLISFNNFKAIQAICASLTTATARCRSCMNFLREGTFPLSSPARKPVPRHCTSETNKNVASSRLSLTRLTPLRRLASWNFPRAARPNLRVRLGRHYYRGTLDDSPASRAHEPCLNAVLGGGEGCVQQGRLRYRTMVRRCLGWALATSTGNLHLQYPQHAVGHRCNEQHRLGRPNQPARIEGSREIIHRTEYLFDDDDGRSLVNGFEGR
jgi:hypothetical protein